MRQKKLFPKGSVCKPCWELKYCPYGPIVEFFPFPTDNTDLDDIKRCYYEVLAEFIDGNIKTEEELWDGIRRLMFLNPELWEDIQYYTPEDVGCRIWGHSCPVFWTQSGATETKDVRREGRAVPRDIMFKVVRRDNHVCQVCHQYIPDNEVEFDHIIPYSKGGPTSVSNIRLLCRACNRKKSDALDDLLSK